MKTGGLYMIYNIDLYPPRHSLLLASTIVGSAVPSQEEKEYWLTAATTSPRRSMYKNVPELHRSFCH